HSCIEHENAGTEEAVMTDEPEVLAEDVVDEELGDETDEEIVEDEDEDEDEDEHEGDEGDEGIPEGIDPIEFWRDRFKHTQRKLGEQGNELGQLRQFRDMVLTQEQVEPMPPEASTQEDPAIYYAAQQQAAVGELALEKYDELVNDGWPIDAEDDHRTWGESLKRAAREHSRLQQYAGRIAEEQLGPLKGLVLESAAPQLLSRDVQAAMPEVSGITQQEVVQALGTGVEIDKWMALPPDARAGLIELTAKSLAYDRLTAGGPQVPSPDNPRVALPGGGGRSQDPRLAKEIAHLRAINPDITPKQAEARVKAYYGGRGNE
ncbi:MAG TPA: hypothetical protein VGM23_16185, partial [Armatimonadota bacterium]